MLKSPLLIALFLAAHGIDAAIPISPAEKKKHAFVKKMRASQKENGKITRKLSADWSTITAKSSFKPGVRAGSPKTTEITKDTKDPIAPSTKKKVENRRHLEEVENDAAEEQGVDAETVECEEGAPDDDNADVQAEASITGSWWQFWKNNKSYKCRSNNNNYNDNSAGSWGNYNGYGTNETGNDDMWYNNAENQTYVIDTLADFSMKYTGCSSLTSFVGGNGESDLPLESRNFVSYRLCPLESCTDDSWRGCNQQYGEYMINLQDFLEAQANYVNEEFEYFCNYCEECLYFDKWYSGHQETDDYDEDYHVCAHYNECYNYTDACEGVEGEEYQEENLFKYEDFFECKEVDISMLAGYYGEGDDGSYADDFDISSYMSDYGYDETFTNGQAYVGTHCLEGQITVGIFADDTCLDYVGAQLEQINTTEYELEATDVEDLYLPEGCVACGGDNVNIKQSQWYVTNDEREERDYDENEEVYVSEVCYNMFEASAKCHSHFTDDSMPLELSDSEALGEGIVCDFIEDVVKGYVDNEGLVYSHQVGVSSMDKMFVALGGSAEAQGVTVAQGLALTTLMGGSAAMAFVVYDLKKKFDFAVMEGLIKNEHGVV